jgi:hypothetical protein
MPRVWRAETMKRSMLAACALLVMLGARMALCAEGVAAQAIAQTTDVEVSLVPDKPEVETEEPLLITLKFKNVGKMTYTVIEDYFGAFHDSFVVKDAGGKMLPNPYRKPRS